jgi:hypothetical protein
MTDVKELLQKILLSGRRMLFETLSSQYSDLVNSFPLRSGNFR